MQRNPQSGRKCLLISMPWAHLNTPSLSTGILKAVLLREGVCCDVLYAALRMLRYVKPETYIAVAPEWAVCDFAFAHEFEPDVSGVQMDVLRRISQDRNELMSAQPLPAWMRSPEGKVDLYLRLRQEVIPRFLDDLMVEVDFHEYAMVGFSCTFHQTYSSLALAQRIRKKYPGLMIAFGGSSLAKPTGPALQQAFSGIDVVAYGDGESVIVPLMEAARGNRDLREVPNITYRSAEGRVIDSHAAASGSMADSPTPNYDDFFADIAMMRQRHGLTITVRDVPAESSRGCWWGARSRCVFCGLHPEAVAHRVKPATLVARQLDELHDRYGVTLFTFVDDVMPLENCGGLFAELERRGAPYKIAYQGRPTLTRSQVSKAARAGMLMMFVGVESFVTSLLRKMKKGVSSVQNIFVIYSMMQHGIICVYNLLYGLIGETPAECRALIEILPSLYHLMPPFHAYPVKAVRHSTLLKQAAQAGHVLGPHWRYDLILSPQYRKTVGMDTSDFAYYFADCVPDDSDVRTLHDVVQHQHLTWRDRFYQQKASLVHARHEQGVVVRDTRFGGDEQVYHFGQAHGRLCDYLLGCDGPCAEDVLTAELSGPDVTRHSIRAALQELCDARIVIEDEGKYVWIAFDEDVYARGAQRWSTPEPLLAFGGGNGAV